MSEKLILFPFGGNTREALMTIQAINGVHQQWDVIGFIDDDSSKWDQEACGVKVLGGRDVLQKYPEAKVLAAPGEPNSYLKRKDIIDGLVVEETRFAKIIDPTVIVSSDAQIGYNTLLMPYAVISCGVSIGNHCVILSQTVISHESQIGDYCCIGSNVSVSGKVIIKSQCYIGSGSSIRNDITVEERSLVGLGSNVVKDVEKEVVVAGNPAKILPRRPR